VAIIHAKSLACDNDSVLNIPSLYDSQVDSNENRASMSKIEMIRSEDIFTISDSGLEMRSCFEQQQKSSLYSIVQRKRESDEDSI
jgi:hypothetical protein